MNTDEIIEAEIVIEPLDKVGAVALTARIRTALGRAQDAADDLWRLLLEAYEGRAWEPLGYSGFKAYLAAELPVARSHAYRLLDKGRLVREITAACSSSVPSGTRELESAVSQAIPAAAADRAKPHTGRIKDSARKAASRAAATGADPAEAAGRSVSSAISRLPSMPRNRGPAADDPDRARRAAEYAARTGKVPLALPAFSAAEPVVAPPKVRHCPTCTC